MGWVYIVWKLIFEFGKFVCVVDGLGGVIVLEVWFVDFIYYCGVDWNM